MTGAAGVIPMITEKTVSERRNRRVSEIAAIYAISDAEVYRAIRSGALKALKYKSKGWLIILEDAEQWFSENTESNVAA